MIPFLIHILIIFALYAIIAVGLNLVVGYTGLLSITQAGLAGIGAYTTSILAIQGWNFFLAMAVGMVFTILAAVLVGFILSRLSGDYYVLGTVAFNYIMYSIFLNWDGLTGGALGTSGIPRPELFGITFLQSLSFLVLVLLFFACTYGVCQFLANSSFGRTLKAIREDEKTLAVFGYRTLYYKVAVFAVGAATVAIAGALQASYVGYIDPTNFTVFESVIIFSMVVVGGAGNMNGAVLGAFLLTILPELLRFVGFSSDIAAEMRQAVYGLLLILLMLYRPQGLIGEYKL